MILLLAGFIVAAATITPMLNAGVGRSGSPSLRSRGIGGVATWARVCLGRNWGMPMTVRARPTLVPAALPGLRGTPIYSGLLVAGDRWRWRPGRAGGGGDRRGRTPPRQHARGE